MQSIDDFRRYLPVDFLTFCQAEMKLSQDRGDGEPETYIDLWLKPAEASNQASRTIENPQHLIKQMIAHKQISDWNMRNCAEYQRVQRQQRRGVAFGRESL